MKTPESFDIFYISFLTAERYVPPHLRRNPQELFHNDPRNPVNFPAGGAPPQNFGRGAGRDGGFRGTIHIRRLYYISYFISTWIIQTLVFFAH